MPEILTEESLYSNTPQQLTLVLYRVLEERMSLSIESIESRRYDEANEHLQKCNDILHRLGSGLNYEAGIIADQLESLYRFLAEQTIQANMKKDIQIIAKNIEIVKMIADAWVIAMNSSEHHSLNNRVQKSMAYESSYESTTVDIKE